MKFILQVNKRHGIVNLVEVIYPSTNLPIIWVRQLKYSTAFDFLFIAIPAHFYPRIPRNL